MSRHTIPCRLCQGKPAKTLRANHPDGSGYVYAEAVEHPVFCSVRCAANWGLLAEHPEYCQTHGWLSWENCCAEEEEAIE